jgi:hypothetical protein
VFIQIFGLIAAIPGALDEANSLRPFFMLLCWDYKGGRRFSEGL